MKSEAEHGRSQRSGSWRERAWLAAVCALVGCFYGWTARPEGVSWNFGQRQTDYYNLLVDGFLDGHLYMKVEVPEALLRRLFRITRTSQVDHNHRGLSE